MHGTAKARRFGNRLLGIGILVYFLVNVATAAPAPANELTAVGGAMATALNNRDIKAIEKLFDLDGLVLRVVRNAMLNEREAAGFVAGFKKSASVERLFANQLASLQRDNGRAEMMKLVQRDNEYRPLLRLDFGDSGFEYIECVVEKNADGRYRMVDWYQLSSGDLLSVTIAVASKLLIDPNPGFVKSVLGVGSINDDVVTGFKSLGQLQREQKFVEALKVIDSMPAEVANSRLMMTLAAQLSGQSKDESLYRRALAKLAERHGDDPAVAVLLVDHYFYEGNVEKALRSIAAMESRVGRDGLTELLKANMYRMKGMYDQMLSHAQQAVQLEPNRPDGYLSLADGYIRKGQFSKAVETYTMVSAKFDYRFKRTDFEDDAATKSFVRSDEFKKWQPEK